jgi:hypothetical protein
MVGEKTYEEKMKDLAEERGLGRDLSKLKASEYRSLAIAVRPKVQRVKDAGRAIASRGLTTIGLRVIPEHIARRNEGVCRACPDGKFVELADGAAACNACNCSDKYLEAKWRDRAQACPRGHWSNRAVQMGDEHGSLPIPGDSQAKGGARA